MTQEEIICMAKECGVHEYGPLTRNWSFELSQFERFAALVAAHEREACAKVCAQLMTPWDENTPNHETIALRNDGMRQCAAAIRARAS